MQIIYNQLLPGKPVWDLCCDHGYLGIRAYLSGNFSVVYFVDKVPEIIKSLELKFRQIYENSDGASSARFQAKAGEDINEAVQGTLVIAGVGAHTILKILQNLHLKQLLHAEKLILAPQRHESWLLDSMTENENFRDFAMVESIDILERGRLRKLLIFKRI